MGGVRKVRERVDDKDDEFCRRRHKGVMMVVRGSKDGLGYTTEVLSWGENPSAEGHASPAQSSLLP